MDKYKFIDEEKEISFNFFINKKVQVQKLKFSKSNQQEREVLSTCYHQSP